MTGTNWLGVVDKVHGRRPQRAVGDGPVVLWVHCLGDGAGDVIPGPGLAAALLTFAPAQCVPRRWGIRP